MSETTGATIYLDSDVHRALRLKAASTHRSVSDLVTEPYGKRCGRIRKTFPQCGRAPPNRQWRTRCS